MAQNHIKSDDERLFAAIQGGVGQNTDGDNENQQLHAKYVMPTAGVTAEFHANADINTQSKRDSNTSNIDPSTSLSAETSTGLDYTNNRDFVASSGQAFAEGMQRKQEIVGKPREAVSVEDGPYVCATDDVLGLSRSETVKQQSAYQAATLEQNGALMSSGGQLGRVQAPGLITNDNNGEDNNDTIVKPGVALFVANRNYEIESVAPAHKGMNEENNAVVYAVMVKDPSDDERPRKELPLAKAQALVPLHKQFRVWFVAVAVLGTIVALIVVLPGIGVQPVSNPYQVQQRGALVALYDAANGDEWLDSMNWLSNASICEWYGIDCNNDGDVIVIDLGYNNVHGSIPSELGLLTNLNYLGLRHNTLRGSIPSEMGLLVNLEVLNLYHNSLTDAIPSEMGLLANLEEFYLYHNSLTGTLPDEVCALSNDDSGNLSVLRADCEEVMCPCCNYCCVDGVGCSYIN